MSTELAQRVAANRFWYHTIELAPGVVTPGHFDIRGVVDRIPWPELRGKRCLDVGTFDGFYAFEMERRGASEVVAIDIDDPAEFDFMPRAAPTFQPGEELGGSGFRIAAEALGSQVERIGMSVYDLTPDAVGRFDVVFCGTLLQHLRDPLAALLAMHSVCAGRLLTVERIDTFTSVVLPRLPVQRIIGNRLTWSMPNAAGHRALVHTAGFDIEKAALLSKPHGVGYGMGGHPRKLQARARRLAEDLGRRRLTGSTDPPFSAVLAHPATTA